MKRHICPECNKETVVDIIYGYPSDELLEEARQNKVVLGGCVVEESNPEFRCLNCNKEW